MKLREGTLDFIVHSDFNRSGNRFHKKKEDVDNSMFFEAHKRKEEVTLRKGNGVHRIKGRRKQDIKDNNFRSMKENKRRVKEKMIMEFTVLKKKGRKKKQK